MLLWGLDFYSFIKLTNNRLDQGKLWRMDVHVPMLKICLHIMWTFLPNEFSLTRGDIRPRKSNYITHNLISTMFLFQNRRLTLYVLNCSEAT